MKKEIKKKEIKKEVSKEKRIAMLTGGLWWLLSAFQVMTMLFLAYREDTVNEAALQFAWILPVVSWALYLIVCKLFKADRILLLTMLFLCSVSLAILTRNASSEAHHIDQAIFMGIGIAAMLAAMAVARTLERWSTKWIWFLAVIAAGALVVPRFFDDNNGAYNWIVIGPVSVQPSEFIKVFLPIMLAHFAVKPGKGGWLFVACMIAAVYCAILAVVQADLGAAVIYFLVTLGLYYAGGGSGIIAGSGLGVAVILVSVMITFVSRVRVRIEAWQNPMIDPEGKGWQMIQSMTALGSAGWMGRGFGKGESYSITLYNSDGVFVAISEEFGLLFGLLLMGIYMIMVWRGITIALNTNSKFRRIVSLGLSMSMGLQTMLIVAGITKLIPLTGVTMPFVASGGSSMVSCMIAMGILLSFSIKERKTPPRIMEDIW